LKSRAADKKTPRRKPKGSGQGPGFEATLLRLGELSEAASASGKFAPLKAAVVDAIDACDDAAQLWSLLSIEGVSEATFGEAELQPEVAKALLARAAGWGDTPEAAYAIALAVRAS